MSRRVLVFATTTGYQTRMFADAAERLGVDLIFATDRCHELENPWGDSAIAVRFFDEEHSLPAILEVTGQEGVAGLLAVGDQPTVLAALVARALGLPGHPPEAVRLCRNKLAGRETWRAAGLPVPWFEAVRRDDDPRELAWHVPYPCVVKPLALSGSRGVIRADDPEQFVAAFDRVRRLLRSPDVAATRNPENDRILIESFIEGREFALEGVLTGGRLRTLALFDKPDPLDGPFFEETIYATPSNLPPERQREVGHTVARAADALGLRHGPIHAECRVNQQGTFVLEIAARPIGGLCARALRFDGRVREAMPFEELLLRHALGEAIEEHMRERTASGVMMIPIPVAGVYRGVEGVEAASGVAGVDEIWITCKEGHRLVPLPEGASYLGFIIARGESRDGVIEALRAAHEQLRFLVDRPLTVVQ